MLEVVCISVVEMLVYNTISSIFMPICLSHYVSKSYYWSFDPIVTIISIQIENINIELFLQYSPVSYDDQIGASSSSVHYILISIVSQAGAD